MELLSDEFSNLKKKKRIDRPSNERTYQSTDKKQINPLVLNNNKWTLSFAEPLHPLANMRPPSAISRKLQLRTE